MDILESDTVHYIIIPVLGLLATYITIYLSLHSARARRKRLLYRWEASALTTANLEKARMAYPVTREGKEVYTLVENPYLLKVKLRYKSHVDIVEEDFSKPIEADAKFVSRIGPNIVNNMGQELSFVPSNNSLALLPCVVTRGDGVKLTILYDGRPALQPFRGFRNVRVIREGKFRYLLRKSGEWLPRIVIPASLLLAFYAFGAGWIGLFGIPMVVCGVAIVCGFYWALTGD